MNKWIPLVIITVLLFVTLFYSPHDLNADDFTFTLFGIIILLMVIGLATATYPNWYADESTDNSTVDNKLRIV